MTTGNHKIEIAEKILKEKLIDLIVMGATGRGKIKSAICGNCVGYVTQYATWNVLVVKE